MMEAMLKFRGKESDVRKLVSIFEAIIWSDAFKDIEVVDRVMNAEINSIEWTYYGES